MIYTFQRIAAGRAMNGSAETHYAHFATIDRMVERFVNTGVPRIPIERTLLATCASSRMMDLLHEGGGFATTPELVMPYLPLRRSRYSRSDLIADFDRGDLQ